jgi:hypothetical protein
VGPTLPAASPLQSPSSCLLSPTGFRIAHCPPSPTISDLDVGSIPPSPTLSSHSGTHFHTSIQLRDNHPDQSSSGLTSLGLLSSKTPGHSRRGRNATLDEDIRDSDDDDQPRSVSTLERFRLSSTADCYLKVHVFPNAQNLLIQDTAINSAGRDITIIHNNVTYAYHDPEPVLALFMCLILQ